MLPGTTRVRPTVYRLLDQLRTAGAVQLRRGLWELSPGLLGLAQRIEPVAGLRVAASGIVQALREQTGAAVSLVVAMEAASFVALDMIPGRDDLPLQAHAGAVMPSTTAAALVLDRVFRLRDVAGVSAPRSTVRT